MFVLSLHYKAPEARIDAALPRHREWLEVQYAEGAFVASGRKVPRTGGMILAKGSDRAEIERRIAGDPFLREGLAEYEVTEFEPTRVAEGLEALTG